MSVTQTMTKAKAGDAEAKTRDALRLALAKRDLLVSDLARAEKAATRAQERAWDREGDVEALEAAAKRRREAGMGGGDEKALVDSIMAGGVLIDEKDAPDPELERLKAEASALRAAAAKLTARLPERREQVSYAESAVKRAAKVVVASSAAVQALLDETENLSLEVIRRRAILAAAIGHLPSDSVEAARALAVLHPLVFASRHPEAESFRQACEALARSADAPLPVVEARP